MVNKSLLTGDNLMPEKHLKSPRVTYRSSGPFTKNNERMQEFKETYKKEKKFI